MNDNGKVIGDNMTMQSAGGKARAESLSPNERSNIASEGGRARSTTLSPERKSEIAAQGGKAKAEKK